MNKLRLLTIAVIVLLLLNIGTLIFLYVSRRPGMEGPPPPVENAGEYIVRTLHLDAEQISKFEQLRRQHHDLVMRAQDRDRELHDQYFRLLKSDSPYIRQADSLSELIAGQRAAIDSATFDHFSQLRAICHEDQKALFDKTIDEISRLVGGSRQGPPPPNH